ncbi:MAG: SDR family oxidoreductase [Candidatus Rokubacteria bacterium]|nr:SDR family oxidoreductase [Candidatus Rokubacteria bacterium]MBI3827348.1 SDR family oxidoreductase [Candidatus Rokubacteria bacterium]
MNALDGKVAVIAGGGAGSGRGTAERFAAAGARVVVFGRRPAPLAETVAAVTKEGGRGLAVSGGGSIVHVGSAAGTVAVQNFAPYVASKGGLHMLARAAAVELIGEGIRVNVVAAGTIDTDLGQGINDFDRRVIEHRIPIRRAGTVEDVAAASLCLASDAARYVTGAVLAVDGGWTAS